MILRKYGLELRSIQKADLELIRVWRNDASVKKSMFFQNEISTQEQQHWYATLSNSDVYLMIVYKEQKIGVINVKDIDWEKRVGEAGIFVGEPSFRNSFIPMLAIFCLMDTFFEGFDFTHLNARIRTDNEEALIFNQELGYEIDQESGDQLRLTVSKDGYLRARQKIARFLRKFKATDQTVELTTEERQLFHLSAE